MRGPASPRPNRRALRAVASRTLSGELMAALGLRAFALAQWQGEFKSDKAVFVAASGKVYFSSLSAPTDGILKDDIIAPSNSLASNSKDALAEWKIVVKARNRNYVNFLSGTGTTASTSSPPSSRRASSRRSPARPSVRRERR